jgi:hypothetical protein
MPLLDHGTAIAHPPCRMFIRDDLEVGSLTLDQTHRQ